MTISAVISPVIRNSLLSSVVGTWNGLVSSVLGAMFSFLNNEYSTTVPGGQSRTFLETHVYTGGPKLTLKSDGNIGWNNHNTKSNSDRPEYWTLTNVTVDAGTELAPDGVSMASVLRNTTATANHRAEEASVGYAGPDGASFSVYVKKPSGSTANKLIFHANGGTMMFFDLDTLALTNNSATIDNMSYQSVGNGWYFVSGKLNTSFGANYLGLGLMTDRSGSTSYAGLTTDTLAVWRFQYNYGQTLFTHPATSSVGKLDEPTIFNTSGTRLGILLEPAATNVNRDSQNLLAAGAFVAGGTVVTNGANAPDGTSTFNEFTEDLISSSKRMCTDATGFAVTAGATYTASVFVSSAVRQYAAFGLYSAPGTVWATFDLINGTISQAVSATGTGTAVSARIEHFFGTIYRLSVTGSLSGATNAQPLLAPSLSATPSGTPLFSNPYTGTGAIIKSWGYQLELGTYASSYIPTTTASVTRTADTCYRVLGPEMPASSPYSVGLKYAALLASATADILSVGPTSNDSHVFYQTGANLANKTRVGGVDQVVQVIGPTALVSGQSTKRVARFATNDFNGASDGNLGSQDSSCTMPTGYTRIAYGTAGAVNTGGSTPMLINKLAVWSSGLSDADLTSWSSTETSSTQPTLDFNYETGVYTYTPVNAGVTTTYSLSTLISSGLMTLTGSPSAKWVRGSNGLITEVAAGNLAIEYDVNGNVLGCINTEPARTNQCLRSDELSNASWTPVNATVTADQANGPTGATTLDLLKENTVTGAHSIQLPSSTTTVQSYVLSCFARVGPGSRHIMLYGLNMDGRGVGFNLTNGTTFTVGGISLPTLAYGIEDWGGGLYRCYAGFTGAATTGAAGGIYLVSGTTFSYTGDNTSGAYVGSVQLEAGTYPSSYIPTTSAAVTRNADVWTLNLGSWFDNSKWIVASKVYAPRANMTAGSVTPAIWALNVATPASANYAAEWLSSTNRIDFLERTNSTDGAAGNATTLSFPATVRSALGWAPSNAKASLNGSTQTLTGTPSPNTTQQAFVTLRFGDSERSNADQGSVYIQSLNILPVIPTQDNVNQYASGA